MVETVIQAVNTRTERKAAFNLPWKLYHNDPNWIPPLRQNQLELMGFRKHPFYDRNEVQVFLATQNGKAVGRIAAITNLEHNRRYNDKIGFVGFFESIDEPDVANGLFDAAAAWLKERGLDTVRGPVNPSLNHEVGLLTDGFDTPPTFMMTYNHPYYPALFEQAGFVKAQDLFSFDGHVDMLETLDTKLDFVIREATRRFNIKMRPLSRSRFDEDVRLFLNIYNQSLGGTWGFTPLSEAEIDHVSKSLKHLIVPELTTICEVDGKPIAAVFGLLDYNPRIKLINGRLFPFGFFRLLFNRKAIKRIRLLSTNVIPEYQRWGVGLVALSRLVPDILKWGIQEAEFSWVLESNHLSYKTLKRGGAILSKSYRIYDRPIEEK
ncbi:MAG TPA: N-acetyltransferase [Planctomycetes bacterium]|nr:N-acetyltransferase [Planctomycetaceae bacterium]HIM31568.1 N-acetyltransferase [Planctomycetota bacterium]